MLGIRIRHGGSPQCYPTGEAAHWQTDLCGDLIALPNKEGKKQLAQANSPEISCENKLVWYDPLPDGTGVDAALVHMLVFSTHRTVDEHHFPDSGSFCPPPQSSERPRRTARANRGDLTGKIGIGMVTALEPDPTALYRQVSLHVAADRG
jgi:hypothetical protein